MTRIAAPTGGGTMHPTFNGKGEASFSFVFLLLLFLPLLFCVHVRRCSSLLPSVDEKEGRWMKRKEAEAEEEEGEGRGEEEEEEEE
eukprot:3408210-Pyramimonas_sp.AAC.1